MLRRVFGYAALPALLCSVSQQAAAQSYLLAGAGASTNRVEFVEHRSRNGDFAFDDFRTRDHGTSALLFAGFGTHLQSNFRGELVVSYRPEYSSRINSLRDLIRSGGDSRLRSLSALASLYYDFPVSWLFKPYVGGGLGATNNRFTVDAINLNDNTQVAGSRDSNTHFAWQLGAGAAVNLGPAFTLDLGYRYFDGGTLGFGQKLQAQEVQVNIRLNIG